MGRHNLEWALKGVPNKGRILKVKKDIDIYYIIYPSTNVIFKKINLLPFSPISPANPGCPGIPGGPRSPTGPGWHSTIPSEMGV